MIKDGFLEKKTSGKNVEDVAESYSYELVEGKRKITTRQALSTAESYYNLLTGNLEKESIKLTNGPEAQTTLYYYDGFGRETSVVYPNNKISKQTLSWNTGGKGYYAIKKEMTGKAPVTKYFDVLGREIYSNVKQGDVNTENVTLYDAFGRKTAEISMHPRKSGWTKYEYCRDGRLESVLTHTGRKEVYEYRKRNIIIIRNEKRYLKSLDSWGNILNQTDPLELTIYNTYASNGQVVRTSVGDHEITMSYDDRGNKLSMNDPDIGVVTYTYDGYGRAKTYSDPKGSYKLTYDNLGRLKQKLFSTGREVNYTYVDSGNGVGLVKEVSVKDESRQSFEYNKYGQILKKTETIDNQQFVYSNEYDAWGRLTKHTAPGKYVLKYAYDDNDGRLLNVQDNNGKILWKNVRYIPGREEVCQYDNQLTYTTLSSENESERILRYTKQDGSTLLEMKYGLDPILGNVLNRNEKYNGKTFTEQFEYDEMDRLIDVSGNSSMHISFDGGGNILSKSDMGEYRYNDAARTHALTDIESPSDVLKNLPAQKIEYTEFNKVSLIEEGHYKMSFVYNADEQRIKSELYKSGSLIRVIYYGDGYEKHINVNSNIKEYTYLDADGGYFGMHLSNSSGYWSTSSLYYFHADLLGSLIAISNGSGNIAERRSYDAWGRHRNPDNWNDYKNAGTLNLTLIGYTFQEEMPEFNLINLNGRLYDPLLGRMLSPDPFIQDPDNSQNYNRYSYAWNNPMKCKDPNGNFILGYVTGFFKGLSSGKNPFKAGWKGGVNEVKIWGSFLISDPNKNFGGRLWEVVSRFTWQLPQTVFGSVLSNISNYMRQVDKVDYWGGATVLSGNFWGSKGAITIGSYINGSQELKADPNTRLFQHEYGHYLQSQSMGLGFLARIGVPSLISAAHKDKKHKFQPFEQDANRRAFLYFNKNVKGFYKSREDMYEPYGWNFSKNPLDVNHTGEENEWIYIDYHNKSDIERLNSSLSLHTKWYDYFSPFGIFCGIINGLYYDNNRIK